MANSAAYEAIPSLTLASSSSPCLSPTTSSSTL
ncbi:BnaA04g19730D [Brassica napus]|uniref:BnaA04g19730D protein n=1 Tax=Brassica napus TaxID=3708 RepID=A0A078HH80_BRANA|nr:BnaA04g19730D [Brassica napus]